MGVPPPYIRLNWHIINSNASLQYTIFQTNPHGGVGLLRASATGVAGVKQTPVCNHPHKKDAWQCVSTLSLPAPVAACAPCASLTRSRRMTMHLYYNKTTLSLIFPLSTNSANSSAIFCPTSSAFSQNDNLSASLPANV